MDQESIFAGLLVELRHLERGANRIINRAVKRGIGIVRDGIEAAAPIAQKSRRIRGRLIEPGGLKKSIGDRIRPATTRRVAEAKAGPAVGKGTVPAKYGEPVNGRGKRVVQYGHFRALGTAERWTGKKRITRKGARVKLRMQVGKRLYRGRVTARGWVVSGGGNASAAANQAVINEIRESIDKLRGGQTLADAE